MAIVYTAPDEPDRIPNQSIFLAGAIDMGAAVDWQSWVIEQLRDADVCVFNPRRAAFTPDTLDEQIRWELDKLDRVDHIFLWFPKDAKAPISFFEAGLYWQSGKLIVGAEQGFYRRRNLELTGEYYGIRVWDTLEQMLDTLEHRIVEHDWDAAEGLG